MWKKCGMCFVLPYGMQVWINMVYMDITWIPHDPHMGIMWVSHGFEWMLHDTNCQHILPLPIPDTQALVMHIPYHKETHHSPQVSIIRPSNP